jgi:hypothetical protein
MSLFSKLAENLASGGLDGIAKAGADVLTGGPGTGTSGDIGTNAAINIATSHIPPQASNVLRTGARVADSLLHGEFSQGAMQLVNSGLLNKWIPGLASAATQRIFWRTPTPCFGGISPAEAKQIYDSIRNTPLAKKNLWLLEITSRLNYPLESQRFNLYATEIEFEPCIVVGDKQRVGGAVVDTITGNEAVEMRITTIDDKTGTFKHWFDAHKEAVAHRDGTVGLPNEYAITIKIAHSYITRATAIAGGAYEDIGLFRPVNRSTALSRREDGLEEVQMTFAQMDTFMRP